jgi:hypothetical protein
VFAVELVYEELCAPLTFLLCRKPEASLRRFFSEDGLAPLAVRSKARRKLAAAEGSIKQERDAKCGVSADPQ